MQKNRQSLTKRLCQLTKNPTEYETALKTWWWSKYSNGGLRLTVEGLLCFTNDIDIQSYTWKLPEPLRVTPGILLKLDRKLDNPYYVRFGGKKEMFVYELILFAEKDATFLALIGSLDKFLENL